MKTDSMINKYDEQGRANGPWEQYYSNGQLWHKGEYKEGWQHGIWEDYLSNGKLTYKGELKNKKQIGLWYEERYD